MPGWVLVFMVIAGVLFALKILYAAAAGFVLPLTRGGLFVGTPGPRIAAFLDNVYMGPGTLLVDLGCGDGRVLRAARRRYGVRAIGFEINPLAYGVARLLSLGRAGITIRYANFWKEDLRRADVVFCYLFPDLMTGLAEKLKRELRPGCTVVSCNFPLPGWKAKRVLRPDHSRHGDPVYIYEILRM